MSHSEGQHVSRSSLVPQTPQPHIIAPASANFIIYQEMVRQFYGEAAKK